jgi:hypothetical protein
MGDVSKSRPAWFDLNGRIRSLRSDQRGSVTLLAGMMVFLVTIFAVIALDTNLAIRNRIIAQNAADSAASAAALWQARSCNLLQHLNNLHYTVDTAACIAEGVATAACVTSAALLAAEIAATASVVAAAAAPVLRIARQISCFICVSLPVIDAGQDKFYKAIMPFQQGIVNVTPFLVYGYANASAKGSGADNLFGAMTGFVSGVLGQLGVSDIDTGGVGAAIGKALSSIPVYAAPLSPNSLKLSVAERANDGSPPLKWPEAVGLVGMGAGYIGCSDTIFRYQRVESKVMKDKKKNPYGWNDNYFFGHPGFMTWVAGKESHDEILGLGNLKWLNGGLQNADEISRLMYTGESSSSGSTLRIPGFVALASSQIEGTPVVLNGDADAKGKLIKVYRPGGSNIPLVYH